MCLSTYSNHRKEVIALGGTEIPPYDEHALAESKLRWRAMSRRNREISQKRKPAAGRIEASEHHDRVTDPSTESGGSSSHEQVWILVLQQLSMHILSLVYQAPRRAVYGAS